MPSPVKALLDANVLYSNHLRNLLLQMAQNYLFDAKWSEEIEDEWLRNMEPRTAERIRKATLPLIRSGFPEALVTGFDPDRTFGVTDVKDRHVASAAATIAPCRLVTLNLKHFDAEALRAVDVEVCTPDAFLTEVYDGDPDATVDATKEAAANLTKSAPSWEEYLDDLTDRHGLKQFVERLRAWKPTETLGPEDPLTP